jgi:chitin synthase
MNLKQQKYVIAFALFCINLLLSTTFIVYDKEWYVYLFILILASLINASSVLCITGHKMVINDKELHRIEPKNYLYVVPCYNESEEELLQSLNSLILQRNVNKDNRSLLIICDGMVKGKENIETTDNILKKILNINELAEFYDYKTWDDNRNIIKIHTGKYHYQDETMDFMLIIKNKNYGKRDSLVLVRKMCYSYNTHTFKKGIAIDNNNEVYDFTVSESLFKYTFEWFKTIFETNLDYMIGIDADTVFDYNCSYELIQEMEKDSNVHGCVGYVDILPAKKASKGSNYSPFILYQYGEYMFSQCLRRYAQSKITKKVNCLSGCNQILRVSKETCGDAILNVLNYLPAREENIFNHIRSYASEDRNHICHMLSMYPHVKSTQALKAVAYTSVPTTMEVFLSQRRRWTLGAITNDMLLVYMPDINPFERVAAFVNVMTHCFTPFIFIATLMFIKAIIQEPSMLMLYLSIIIFIPFLYAFLIPVFIRPLSFRNALYYYLAYLFFLMVGSFIKLMTFGYSSYYMDSMTWGKTREIEAHDVVVHDESATVVACETFALDDRPWKQVLEELQTVVTPSGSIAPSDSIEPCESSSTSVDVCSPNDVLEEYMNVYCDETIFDPLKGNTQSKVEFFEINI